MPVLATSLNGAVLPVRAVDARPFVTAQDDLGGKPGTFTSCAARAATSPTRTRGSRSTHIAAYYDDTYIAHRKKRDWGVLTPLFERAMNKLDAAKDQIVSPLSHAPA